MTPLANPLDWRRQVEARPLLSVGAAFIGGVILGGVTSGNDDREASCYQYDPSRSQYHPGERRTDRSLASAVRSAVRASGVEETLSSAVAAALTIAGQRVKEVIDEWYPGFSER
ncbi:hypothetical protein BH20CHL4_BH20CHL4_11530 [soil metagenome]